MDCEFFRVRPSRGLYGTVPVHGAKNAVLPLLAAALLTEDEVVIEDCPFITDVDNMLDLMRTLGAHAERTGRSIHVRGGASRACIGADIAGVMRSSMFMLGVLLAKLGEVSLPHPGGCAIGDRPLDIHIDGVRRMGATVSESDGKIVCRAKRLKGAEIHMRYPSVGATENLMICGAIADGETTLYGCAREPEVVSLARGLKAMGASIEGEGGDVVRITGVRELKGGRLFPVADRIVAGTYVAATALAGGEVRIEGADLSAMESVVDAFSSEHVHILPDSAGVRVRSDGRICARQATTAPYPGFPTDMQPQLVSALCFADGESCVTETVFENRFSEAQELIKAGADIAIVKNKLYIRGGALEGADLRATDLRGGAGLVIAALAAQGESRIFGSKYIDRGYESLETALSSIGADVVRVRSRG